MLKTQKRVKEMMEALDLPLPNEERPGTEGLNFELLRNLVREEAEEFDRAMFILQVLHEYDGPREAENILKYWAEVIDAICDITFVIHNCSNAMGVDIEPFFDEVWRANMRKAGGPLSEDGKRLKPPGWKPPPIETMLRNLLATGEAKP